MAEPSFAPPDGPGLIDDRSDPDFPALYRRLTRRAERLDVAATRIRLSGLRLGTRELRGPEGIRVLLMELNAFQLRTELDVLSLNTEGAARLRGLRELLETGRLEVRALPLGGWAPDFSVFHGPRSAITALIGPHWMERPYPHRGPGWASLHRGEPARTAAARFEELWDEAHRVEGALRRIFRRRRGTGAGPDRG